MGFVVLFGVAVLNGVVLVSHVADLRASGEGLADAVCNGARDRLRPVLMTASIAVFSLIPMLLASGPGSEIQRPLAAVVVGGLISSTALTLLVLPALYGFFEKREALADADGNKGSSEAPSRDGAIDQHRVFS